MFLEYLVIRFGCFLLSDLWITMMTTTECLEYYSTIVWLFSPPSSMKSIDDMWRDCESGNLGSELVVVNLFIILALGVWYVWTHDDGT